MKIVAAMVVAAALPLALHWCLNQRRLYREEAALFHMGCHPRQQQLERFIYQSRGRIAP